MKVAMFRREVTIRTQVIPPWKPICIFDSMLRKVAEKINHQDIEVRDPIGLNLWDGERKVTNMLVFGGGGFGDKIQCTPALRKLSAKIGAPIDVAMDDGEAWENLPYIRRVLPWMVPEETLHHYDAVCSFEDLLGREDEKTDHLAELFAKRCYVEPLVPGPEIPGTCKCEPGEYECDWVWGQGEENTVFLPPKRSLWIPIQVAAHGYSRSWPIENVIVLAMMLAQCEKYNITPLLIGSAAQSPHWAIPVHNWRHELPDPPQGIFNLCGYFATMRQLGIFLLHCDLLVAPDSGPLHLAGVLGVPSIGLYGPHTYETRGKYFPQQKMMQGREHNDPRCPCHCHTDQQDGTIPCGQNFCKLMSIITPEHVYRMIVEALDEANVRRADADCDGEHVVAGVDERCGDSGGADGEVRDDPVPPSADVTC